MSATSQTRRVTTFDIFVGNLPADADQKKLGKIFSKFGEIHNIWMNNTTEGSKYGLVKFYCEEDSMKAIEETNGMLFEGGKPLHVKKATKRGMGPPKKEGDQEEKDMKPRNPDVVPSTEVPPLMPHIKRDTDKLLVSCVETPIIMWGQKLNHDNANELSSILDQLAILCPEAPKVSGKPENDKIYGAQYTEDGCWYRCTVRYIFNENRVKVQYIDFGNTEELNPSTLVELPKSLTALPPCAMKYVLHSLWCNNNQDPTAIKFLKDLVEGQEVEAYTTARLSDQTGFFAEIYINGVCVNEKMLENNFAFRKPGLEQRGLKGRGQGPDGDAGGSNGQSSLLPTPHIAPKEETPVHAKVPSLFSSVQTKPSHGPKNEKPQKKKHHPAQRHIADVPSNLVPFVKRFSAFKQTVAKQNITSCTDSYGPRKFETEKDEINNLRWKLKNLQSEYSSLSNKAQENDVSAQIKILIAHASAVRKLRNQFPLDKETPLDEAIVLVQQSDKIDINMAASLPEVISAINSYKTAQDEIVKCSDKAILEEKIETRNSLRKDLFNKLKTTIEELNTVPLQDRGKKVQNVVSALKKHYDVFTKFVIPELPTIESLLPTFEDWKVKKKSEVVGARQVSDSMKATLKTVFTQLDSLMSLDLEAEEPEMTEDLMSTMRSYAIALQQEIAVADTEKGPDAALIGSLVQALLRELAEEASCVDHLSNVHREFSSLKEQIEPWLDSSPTLEELTKVRGKLKSLKSKLRHKLADKVDAEENQETEELDEIAKDLGEIRGKIHKALQEEDKLIADVSHLASQHFPELLNSESDSVFSTHMTYKGVVKLSYAPDHYKLTSIGSSSSGMFVSQFDGEPVFIKEYFLSNGNHLDKDEFLAHMALYTNASSDYLEPVQAVFFDKNNRHAYVQVKKHGELLSTLVENNVLTRQQCQTIVKSLCMALQALNLYNFVHGQVQPEFVVVDDDGNAKLLPPDFSLIDGDRCRSKFTTSSGMEVIAPEMKPSKFPVEPGHSVDIYCLGLLTLWMHHPTVQFLERKEGTLDFSAVALDHNLAIFLMKLMCPNPMLRPSAENCLRSEYLCQPVRGPSPALFNVASQDPTTGRNSASPASVLSQNSSDGLVYAESGAGMQMIANTRVPPPCMVGDSITGTAPFTPALPPSLQHQGPILASPQQLQQLQMQQQLQQQQQQNQLQQQLAQQAPPPVDSAPSGQPAPRGHSGAFEIGTFDPNAYEVVTSPHPATANIPESGQNCDDSTRAGMTDFADCEDTFKDAEDGGDKDEDDGEGEDN